MLPQYKLTPDNAPSDVVINENPHLDFRHRVAQIKNQMREGRKEPKLYAAFIEAFVPAICGKQLFKDRSHLDKLSVYCTISDEGFILAVLDNYIDRWESMIRYTKKDKDQWKVR